MTKIFIINVILFVLFTTWLWTSEAPKTPQENAENLYRLAGELDKKGQ